MFLNKKHLNFGQGLEFLKFGQGNRDLDQQNRRKSKEIIRTTRENDKTSIRTLEFEARVSYSIISY